MKLDFRWKNEASESGWTRPNIVHVFNCLRFIEISSRISVGELLSCPNRHIFNGSKTFDSLWKEVDAAKPFYQFVRKDLEFTSAQSNFDSHLSADVSTISGKKHGKIWDTFWSSFIHSKNIHVAFYSYEYFQWYLNWRRDLRVHSKFGVGFVSKVSRRWKKRSTIAFENNCHFFLSTQAVNHDQNIAC